MFFIHTRMKPNMQRYMIGLRKSFLGQILSWSKLARSRHKWPPSLKIKLNSLCFLPSTNSVPFLASWLTTWFSFVIATCTIACWHSKNHRHLTPYTLSSHPISVTVTRTINSSPCQSLNLRKVSKMLLRWMWTRSCLNQLTGWVWWMTIAARSVLASSDRALVVALQRQWFERVSQAA